MAENTTIGIVGNNITDTNRVQQLALDLKIKESPLDWDDFFIFIKMNKVETYARYKKLCVNNARLPDYDHLVQTYGRENVCLLPFRVPFTLEENMKYVLKHKILSYHSYERHQRLLERKMLNARMLKLMGFKNITEYLSQIYSYS
jgi:hypothetical protein